MGGLLPPEKGKEKVMPIEHVKTRRVVHRVEQCGGGEGLSFVLKNQPWCEECRDRIHSVSYTRDVVREIQVFRSAGYSESEISSIYDSIHEERLSTGDYHQTVRRELPRPVHVTVHVGRWVSMAPTKDVA